MPVLLFTLAPAGVGHISDVLACLAKFDESVSLEATPTSLRLSSLNQSKTALAAFSLDASAFFLKYHFSLAARESTANEPKAWACKVLNKALLAIFRKRLADGRDKETALERLEFELDAGSADQAAECRLVFRLISKHGVVKTYRLYYESDQVLHASFDAQASTNYWTVASRTLRDVVEYFGPPAKTDQLDWVFQDGRVTFTSFTEKIQSGREILKQPMHTSVALERKDFNDVRVQEGLHIGIAVKDFRSIVAHAETMKVQLTARYSHGNRPMQISYQPGGLLANFTLMTRATSEGTSSSASTMRNSTPARNLSVRAVSVAAQKQQQRRRRPEDTDASEMRPPVRPLHEPTATTTTTTTATTTTKPAITRGNSRESPPAPSASINPDSLFIPADDDDDRRWDEPNFDEEQDIVTWDHKSASTSLRRIQDTESEYFANGSLGTSTPGFHEIEPTQRLSQVKGLFD